MNKARPSERLIRLAALCLCGAVYVVVLVLIFQTLDRQKNSMVPVASPVKLSFVQMELQVEPPPPPEPESKPKPEIQPEPEDADVALEKVPEKPKPEPKPEPPQAELPKPEAPVAQVTQQAAAPVAVVSPDQVQGWVVKQIEKEKYYPPAAERFGLRGKYDLKVTVDQTGMIVSAEVLEGQGHRILRQALERMLGRLPGRKFGRPIGETQEFEVEFSFDLQ